MWTPCLVCVFLIGGLLQPRQKVNTLEFPPEASVMPDALCIFADNGNRSATWTGARPNTWWSAIIWLLGSIVRALRITSLALQIADTGKLPSCHSEVSLWPRKLFWGGILICRCGVTAVWPTAQFCPWSLLYRVHVATAPLSKMALAVERSMDRERSIDRVLPATKRQEASVLGSFNIFSSVEWMIFCA